MCNKTHTLLTWEVHKYTHLLTLKLRDTREVSLDCCKEVNA